MEMFAKLVRGNDSELLSTLTQSGFSAEQAQVFLPEAMAGLTGALKQFDISKLMSMGSGEQIANLTSMMDMQTLGKLAGGDSALAENGLQALLPKVMEMVGGSAGGLGKIAGGLTKLFG